VIKVNHFDDDDSFDNELQSLAKGLSFFRFEDPALFFDRILTSSTTKK
jgi:hypothetical protein